MTYTVTLVDFPAALPDQIRAAEARVRAALDKALADQVAPSLRAFHSAGKPNVDEPTKDGAKLAGDWTTAFAEAKEAGLRGLRDADEACFKVRLA